MRGIFHAEWVGAPLFGHVPLLECPIKTIFFELFDAMKAPDVRVYCTARLVCGEGADAQFPPLLLPVYVPSSALGSRTYALAFGNEDPFIFLPFQ